MEGAKNGSRGACQVEGRQYRNTPGFNGMAYLQGVVASLRQNEGRPVARLTGPLGQETGVAEGAERGCLGATSGERAERRHDYSSVWLRTTGSQSRPPPTLTPLPRPRALPHNAARALGPLPIWRLAEGGGLHPTARHRPVSRAPRTRGCAKSASRNMARCTEFVCTAFSVSADGVHGGACKRED